MPSHAPKDQFTISIDALQIQYCHPPLTAFNSVQFDLTQLNQYDAEPTYTKGATTLTQLPDDKGNRAYHLHYSIDVNGKHIGTIDVNPVRAAYASGLVLFTAANHLLYTNGFLLDIIQFTTDFNLQFHNYSKLDIAIDTTADVMKRFEHCFFNSKDFHFHHNKKQIDRINTFGTIDRKGVTNHTIYLARNVTGRSFKLYNKSIEILENSHKQYITDYHKANGLDMDKDIWRLELSITNKAIKKYSRDYLLKSDANTVIKYNKYAMLTTSEKLLYEADPKHKDYEPIFSQLQDAEHLLSIFKHYTKGLAEFRKKDDSNITRCTSVPLVRLGNNVKPLTAIEYIITSKKHETNKMKHNIKFQFEEFQRWSDMDCLTMAQKIAKRGNLLDYYDALYQQYKPIISAYNHSVENDKPIAQSLF